MNRCLALFDEYAFESFCDIRNDQPPKDRIHYLDVVMESVDSNKGTLIQKLYVDIISKSNIDFGKIPDSKGDLTKYEYYKEISSSIDALNQLTNSSKSEEMTMLNDLYDMIITLRSDYEFGYKFDIEFIKLTYNIAVMSLFEMINICIMAYANYLRDVKGIQFEFRKMKKNDIIVVRGIKSLLKGYKSGEWQKVMTQFKKDQKNFLGLNLNDAINLANKVPGVALDRKNSAIDGSVSTAAIVGLTLIAIATVLLAIRLLIYFFYSAAAKIENYVSVQKEFLEIAMTNDPSDDPKAVKSQEKMLDRLDRIASFIQNKIFKTDADTKKELSASNKENYKKEEFVVAGVGNNSDIEIY